MSGHIPLRAEQLYALHADLSAKFRRLEQIAYTFLEFLLLEIGARQQQRANGFGAARLQGSRVAWLQRVVARFPATDSRAQGHE
jgi:hypothetical protein